MSDDRTPIADDLIALVRDIWKDAPEATLPESFAEVLAVPFGDLARQLRELRELAYRPSAPQWAEARVELANIVLTALRFADALGEAPLAIERAAHRQRAYVRRLVEARGDE